MTLSLPFQNGEKAIFTTETVAQRNSPIFTKQALKNARKEKRLDFSLVKIYSPGLLSSSTWAKIRIAGPPPGVPNGSRRLLGAVTKCRVRIYELRKCHGDSEHHSASFLLRYHYYPPTYLPIYHTYRAVLNYTRQPICLPTYLSTHLSVCRVPQF